MLGQTSPQESKGKEDEPMPVINLDGVGGTLTVEQKRRLCRELVAKASEITEIPAEAFMVLIHEMGYENIGGHTGLLSDVLGESKTD